MKATATWPVVILFAVCSVPAVHGADIVFDLGSPNISNSVATFGVSALFTGAPGDHIDSIQLSVLGSSPALSAGGTDFSRFSFLLGNDAPLSAWSTAGAMGLAGAELLFPNDPFQGPFLTPSATPYNLGTLQVNLAGLTLGPNTIVSLNGGPAGLTTDAGGLIGGNPVFSLAGLGGTAVQFADPNGVVLQAAVPEPHSLCIWACVAMLGCLSRKRWGRTKRADERAAAGC